MLDTEEFRERKERIFQNIGSLNTLSDLSDHVLDLELVCANERSLELANILKKTIIVAKEIENNNLLYKSYRLYFQQIFSYVQRLDEAEEIVNCMQTIAESSNNIEHESLVYFSKALLIRIHGLIEKSDELTIKAMRKIEKGKKIYPDTYYRILFTYNMFMWYRDNDFPDVFSNVEKCVSYWKDTYHTLPMITGIFRLLRLYIFSGNSEKFNNLMQWIFEKERIQDNLIDYHFTLLYSFIGRIQAIRLNIDKAIDFLSEAYHRVISSKSEDIMMYEYIEIQKLLCRSYAFKGEFQKSYQILIEFLNFVESDFVKQNYQTSMVKRLYFGVYYTLLFIFAQLDVNIDNIADTQLKRIHNYTKNLLEKSRISEDLLISNSLDDKQLDKIKIEKDKRPVEFDLSLYQQLNSLKTQAASENTVSNIEYLRGYVYNPLYADIILGKIHLSIGNFREFKSIVKQMENKEKEADTPVLILWIKLYRLLFEYLEDPGNKVILSEFRKLESYCKKNNFIKMSEEINLYFKLITSTKTINNLTQKFQQTAFTDIYNKQSKRMVVEYLDSK